MQSVVLASITIEKSTVTRIITKAKKAMAIKMNEHQLDKGVRECCDVTELWANTVNAQNYHVRTPEHGFETPRNKDMAAHLGFVGTESPRSPMSKKNIIASSSSWRRTKLTGSG